MINPGKVASSSPPQVVLVCAVTESKSVYFTTTTTTRPGWNQFFQLSLYERVCVCVFLFYLYRHSLRNVTACRVEQLTRCSTHFSIDVTIASMSGVWAQKLDDDVKPLDEVACGLRQPYTSRGVVRLHQTAAMRRDFANLPHPDQAKAARRSSAGNVRTVLVPKRVVRGAVVCVETTRS